MKKAFLYNIMIIIVVMLVHQLTVYVASKHISFDSYKGYAIYELTLAVVVTVLGLCFGDVKNIWRMKVRKERTGLGMFLTFFYFFMISILIGVCVYVQMIRGNKPLFCWNTSFFIVFCFLIGYTEEVMYRGLFLGNLLMCKNSKGWKKGVVVAISVLFAMMHYRDFLNNHNIVKYINQILVALVCGLIFACIYMETENIWITVIAHALYDVRAGIDRGIFGYKGILGASMLIEVKAILFGILLMGGIILSIRDIWRIDEERMEHYDC